MKLQNLANVPLDNRPTRMTGHMDIRFPKPGTDFFIGSFTADDYVLDTDDNWHSPDIPIVGETALKINGAPCTVMGKWKRHPRFGEQFNVHSILVSDTRQAEELWLMSGALTGMGHKIAARVIAKFAQGSLFDHINEQDLRSVNGIGPINVKWMLESWEKYGDSARACSFGLSVGLSLRQSRQAWEKWRERMGEILRDHPYELTRLDGLSFQRADEIARSQGHPKESPDRYIAGTVHILERAMMSGHTCLPTRPVPPYKDGVWPELQKLLGGDTRFDLWKNWMINTQVCKACGNRVLFSVKNCTWCGSDKLEMDPSRRVDVIYDKEENIVYLADRELHDIEKKVAAHVKRLVKSKPRPISRDEELTNELITVLAGNDFVPSPDQVKAMKLVMSSNIVVLTGGPGTGKTTTLRIILDYLDWLGLSFICMAPTGKAANRMKEATGREAMTIHRGLMWSPTGFKVNAFAPFPEDVIVVDEASMIDMRIAYALIQAIKNEDEGSRVPPSKLILVGDADQLPPVGPGQFFRDLVESKSVDVARLETIHRQAAKSGIVQNARRIIDGKPLIEELNGDPFDDYYWIEHRDEGTLPQKVVELVETIITKPEGLMILAPTRKIVGECNSMLQDVLNPGQERHQFGKYLFLSLGDPVRQTVNNYTLGVFNGMTGKIVYIMGKDEIAEWKESHSSMETPGVVWVDYGDNEPVIYGPEEVKQLTLAYACTIHSSQGSEWPEVMMVAINRVIPGFITRELVYTGATRAKRRLYIVGHPDAQEIIKRADARAFRHGQFRKYLAD